MKRTCNPLYLILFFVPIFLFNSCYSGIDLGKIDDTSISIDESLVLPLGEANITVKDFINRVGLPKGVDTAANEINLVWDFKESVGINQFNLADSVKPFSQTYKVIDYLPASYIGIDLPPGNDIDLAITDYFDLGINGAVNEQRVDSVHINSSEISVSVDVSSDLKSLPATDFSIQYIFPGNNIVIADGSVLTYYPKDYDENGHLSVGKYSMYLNGLKYLPYTILVRMKPSRKFRLRPTSYVKIYVKFNDIDTEVAYGKFNINDVKQKASTLPFKIEDNLPDAKMSFSDPVVKIKAHSNIGVDLDARADYLIAYNSADPDNKIWAKFANNTTTMTSEFIPGPTVYGQWTTVDFKDFDRTNGQIDRVFDMYPYPDMIDYKYSIEGRKDRTYNFISPDSRVDLDIKVQIPLKVKKAEAYTFTDTIEEFDVKDILNEVDSAILVLKLRNGLPLKAGFRMTFWKSDLPNDTIAAIGGKIDKILDSAALGNITSEYMVGSPKVDANGDVTEIVPQTIQIMLNKEQIEALKQTKFIIYNVVFDTDKSIVDGVEVSNPLHMTTQCNFGVKIGAYVKGKLKSEVGVVN